MITRQNSRASFVIILNTPTIVTNFDLNDLFKLSRFGQFVMKPRLKFQYFQLKILFLNFSVQRQ